MIKLASSSAKVVESFYMLHWHLNKKNFMLRATGLINCRTLWDLATVCLWCNFENMHKANTNKHQWYGVNYWPTALMRTISVQIQWCFKKKKKNHSNMTCKKSNFVSLVVLGFLQWDLDSVQLILSWANWGTVHHVPLAEREGKKKKKSQAALWQTWVNLWFRIIVSMTKPAWWWAVKWIYKAQV